MTNVEDYLSKEVVMLSEHCLIVQRSMFTLLCSLVATITGCAVPIPARVSGCATPVPNASHGMADTSTNYLTLVGLEFGERSGPFVAPPVVLAEATFQASLVNLSKCRANIPWEAVEGFFSSIKLIAADGQTYSLVWSSRPCRSPGVWGSLPSIGSGERVEIDKGWARTYSWCIDRGLASMRHQYPPPGPAVFFACVPGFGDNTILHGAVQQVRYELTVP